MKETKNNDESITYTLIQPLKLGQATIREITLRKPVFGDLEDIKIGGEMYGRDASKLIARLSGQLPAVINTMSLQDGLSLCGAMNDFLPVGPATSEPQGHN